MQRTKRRLRWTRTRNPAKRDQETNAMPKIPRQVMDLTGETFGQLLVVAFAGIHNRGTFWTCKCLACGSVKDYRAGNLQTGLSTACHRCSAKKERKWDRSQGQIAFNRLPSLPPPSVAP